MTSYKIKIVPKNEDFLEEIFFFINEKSIEFKRQFNIDNILNKESSPIEVILKEKSPIILDNVYGSTFQSSFRKNDDIYAISHYINSLIIESDEIYADVTPSGHGLGVDSEISILRPVYYKNEKGKYVIATFDIDFNITNSAA